MPGGGTLRRWREKLEGLKRFHQIVQTIKLITLAKYRQTVVRDETLRITRKVFDQPPVSEEAAREKFEKLLYVPITTNRGSCGALNNNVFRYLEEINSPKMKILAVGKKGLDSLPKIIPGKLDRSIINDMKYPMNFQYAAYIVDHINTFQWDRVQVIYNRYQQASVQRLAAYNLPTFEDWHDRILEESVGYVKPAEGDLVPSFGMLTALEDLEDQTLRDFYDFHFALTVLNATTENELSEYAARIIAVENQLSNITGLLHQADYIYNRTRKELITAELLEIIGTMIVMSAGKKKALAKTKFWEKDEAEFEEWGHHKKGEK